MMQWHDPFPSQPGKQSTAVIFAVRGKGWKIHNDEIRKCKKCERDAHQQEAMSLAGLEDISNGRNHIGNMDGKDEFSKPTIDEPEWRNSIAKDKKERKEEKKERRKRKVIIVIEYKCDYGVCCQSRNRNIQRVVSEHEPFSAALTLHDGFIARAKDLRQQVYARLCKKD